MDSQLRCKICGSSLYNTDQCLTEFSYHCSSADARFWDFERGSLEQLKSKEHWDQSRQEIPNRMKNQVPK